MVFYSLVPECIYFYMVFYSLVPECIFIWSFIARARMYFIFTWCFTTWCQNVYIFIWSFIVWGQEVCIFTWSFTAWCQNQCSKPVRHFPSGSAHQPTKKNLDFYSRQGGLPVLKYSTTGFEAFSQTLTCYPLISMAS